MEMLEFENVSDLDAFVKADNEIWTSFLSKQPGFRAKYLLVDRNGGTFDGVSTSQRVVSLLQWETRAQWKAISAEKLDDVQREFEEAMGGSSPPLRALPSGTSGEGWDIVE